MFFFIDWKLPPPACPGTTGNDESRYTTLKTEWDHSNHIQIMNTTSAEKYSSNNTHLQKCVANPSHTSVNSPVSSTPFECGYGGEGVFGV